MTDEHSEADPDGLHIREQRSEAGWWGPEVGGSGFTAFDLRRHQESQCRKKLSATMS